MQQIKTLYKYKYKNKHKLFRLMNATNKKTLYECVSKICFLMNETAEFMLG